MKIVHTKKILMTVVGVAAGAVLNTSSFAAEANPLAKYLAVPGAKTTLPVSAANKKELL